MSKQAHLVQMTETIRAQALSVPGTLKKGKSI